MNPITICPNTLIFPLFFLSKLPFPYQVMKMLFWKRLEADQWNLTIKIAIQILAKWNHIKTYVYTLRLENSKVKDTHFPAAALMHMLTKSKFEYQKLEFSNFGIA